MKKQKNQYKFSVLNYAQYNIPSVKEDFGKEYVSFGEDNLYPQYLISLYTGSSIHNAITKGVSSMIYGEGLDATDKDETTEKKESYMRFLTLMSGSDENCLKHVSFDLKLHGQAYINVIWNKPRTQIVELKHIPSQYVRSGKCGADGKIEDFYYSADWSNTRKKEYKPQTIKAFNPKDRTQASQILQIKEYNPATFYYGLPDYLGSTDYIQLDMEIAQFHLSNIKSGLFPSAMLNFTNGIPTEEERMILERKIQEKFGGSGNAGKLLITFNDGKETSPTITPISTNDADDQYNFLSTEVSRKVLTGHRVTSPLLFGVKGDGSGFGNNADELRDSYSLFNNTVILVFQNTILQALNKIFSVNDINLDFYFKTLKPADFLDLESIETQSDEEQIKEGVTDEEITQDDGENMREFNDLSDNQFDTLLENLHGEIIDEEWEEVDSRNVGSTEEGYEQWADRLIHQKEEFATAIESKPSGFSYLDKSFYKVRFRYAVGSRKQMKKGSKSRPFCETMMSASDSGRVYRIEDIDSASGNLRFQQSNKLPLHKGQAYDLFRFKGGVYCRHIFKEVLYRLKKTTKIKDGEMPSDISDYKVTRNIPKTYQPSPRGYEDSKTAPVRMPDNGHHPSWTK